MQIRPLPPLRRRPLLLGAVTLLLAGCATPISARRLGLARAEFDRLKAAPGPKASLTVVVEHVRPGKGALHIGLYDEHTAFAFPAPEGALTALIVPASGDSIRTRFTGLPFGRYAVTVFQDEAGTGRLETTLFGRPGEPVGTSTPGSSGLLGQADFKDAAFQLNRSEAFITVTL